MHQFLSTYRTILSFRVRLLAYAEELWLLHQLIDSVHPAPHPPVFVSLAPPAHLFLFSSRMLAWKSLKLEAWLLLECLDNRQPVWRLGAASAQ